VKQHQLAFYLPRHRKKCIAHWAGLLQALTGDEYNEIQLKLIFNHQLILVAHPVHLHNLQQQK
jgi:hypothetical protein